jgi:hypothetical protein
VAKGLYGIGNRNCKKYVICYGRRFIPVYSPCLVL